MKFISDKKWADLLKKDISEILEKDKKLPDKVFNSIFKYFLFIEYNDLMDGFFFEVIKKFVKKNNEKEFFYVEIDPSTESSFFERVGEFPMIVFSEDDREDDFVHAIAFYPFEKSTDALIIIGEEEVIFSKDKTWAIYGSHTCDIGIFGFVNEDLKKNFQELYSKYLIQDVFAASEYAFEVEEDEDLRKAFCENYS